MHRKQMYAICGFLYFFAGVYLQDTFDLFKKFQQHDYQVSFERGELIRYNNKYLNFASARGFKYNRTNFGINITYSMKVDLGYKLTITAQIYKFMSNEYRYFPLRLQINACDMLNNNLMGYGNYKSCGNFTGCPLRKGTYHVCNFMHDDSKFPPYIPNGRYKMEYQGTYFGEEVFLSNAYGAIILPEKYKH